MNIQIAGVTISVHLPKSLGVQNPNPSYRHFLKQHTSPSADIDVVVDFVQAPDTRNLPKIFDGGDSWSMWKDNDRCLVALHSLSPQGKLICAAGFDVSVKNVTLYPGELMTEAAMGNPDVFNPFCYPLDQILLVCHLAQREGALIHSAGMDVDGRGYLFPGKSGAGKTTLSRLFAASKRCDMLSDDRIVVRKIDSAFRMFGTPWPGEARIAQNRDLPLHGIFFIRHGTENAIKKIPPAEAARNFMPVTSIPWYDKDTMLPILSFVEEVVSHIPAYEFFFRPETEAVALFEEFVSSH